MNRNVPNRILKKPILYAQGLTDTGTTAIFAHALMTDGVSYFYPMLKTSRVIFKIIITVV